MYEIDKDTANNILTYLATRPYQEVHKMIERLLEIKPVKAPDKTAEPNGAS